MPPRRKMPLTIRKHGQNYILRNMHFNKGNLIKVGNNTRIFIQGNRFSIKYIIKIYKK